MFTNLMSRIFSKNSVSRLSMKQKGRCLRLEFLEARELLSVSPLLPGQFGNSDQTAVVYETEPQVQAAAPAVNTSLGTITVGKSDTDTASRSGDYYNRVLSFNIQDIGNKKIDISIQFKTGVVLGFDAIYADDTSYIELLDSSGTVLTSANFNNNPDKATISYSNINAVGTYYIRIRAHANAWGDDHGTFTYSVVPPVFGLTEKTTTNITAENKKDITWNFAIASTGDANSYVHAIFDADVENKYTWISLTRNSDGHTVGKISDADEATGYKISLNGQPVGNYTLTVHYNRKDGSLFGIGQGPATTKCTIIVNPAVTKPVITTHPDDAIYLINALPEELSVTATSANSYQWQKSTNNINWTDLTSDAEEKRGAKSSKYTPPATAVGTKYYRCSVTNSRDGFTTSSVYSNSAKITVEKNLDQTSLSRREPKIGTTVNSGSVTLSWEMVKVSSGFTPTYITVYTIERSLYKDFHEIEMKKTIQLANFYTDTGLIAGKTYYYRVNAVGTGNYRTSISPDISITIPQIALTTPSAPTEGAVTNNAITVNWAAVPNASGYAVQKSTDGSIWESEPFYDQKSNTSTQCIASNLKANMTYYFRVIAYGTGYYSNSAWSSSSAPKTTLPTPCNTPSLSVEAISENSIAASWNFVTGANKYLLERRIKGSSDWTEVYKGTNTSYLDAELTAYTAYDYRVQAVGTGDYKESGFSVVKDAITAPAPTNAPTLYAGTVITDTTIELKWNVIDGASGYLIEQSTDESTWISATYPALTGDSTTATVTGLAANALYYFRIKAVGAEGFNNSEWSNTVGKRTLPGEVECGAYNQSSDGASLWWNPLPGLTYSIYSYTNAAGTEGETLIVEKRTASPYYIFQGANTTRYYRIETRYTTNTSVKSELIPVTTYAKKPENVMPQSILDSEFTVRWEVPVGGAERYEVKVYRDVNSTTPVGETITTTSTSQTITDLTENTSYFVEVSAVGKDGIAVEADRKEIKTSPAQPTLPVISVQPQSTTYKQHDNAKELFVTAAAEKADVLYYQWFRNNSAITDATDSHYRPSTATDGNYYCLVTSWLNGQHKTTQSDTATITAIAKPAISAQPQGKTYSQGSAASALSVTVKVKDGSTPHYQWYQSFDGGYKKVGTDSSTYTPSTSSYSSTQYYCEITATINGVESDVTISDIVTIQVVSMSQADTTKFNEAMAKSALGNYKDTDEDPLAIGQAVTLSSSYNFDTTGWIVSEVFTNSLGLYAEGLVLDTNGDGQLSAGESSMLIFQCTNFDFNSISAAYASVLDIIADTDYRGVGYSQYIASQYDLIDWGIRACNAAGASIIDTITFTVTGYSLGGALAQWFAADLTSRNYYIDTVETFSAAGISADWANNKYRDNKVGKVIHNITNGDLVSMAGDTFIGGNRGTVNIYNTAKTGLSNVHTDEYGKRTISKVISSKDLSSDFFHYDGKGYLTTLKGMTSINNALALTAPLLFFRCTVEGARSTIGKYASPISTMIAPSAAAGSIVIPKLPLLGTGGFALKDVSITWDNNGNITATAGLSIPAGMTFGVSLGFVNYSPYIEKIGAYMDADDDFGVISDAKKLAQGKFKEIYGDLKAGIPLGATPLYLQHIEAAVGGFASKDYYFEGGVQLTVGPKVAGQSLVTMDGNIYINENGFILGGTVIAINQNLFKATGELALNWNNGILKGNLQASLAWGLATGELAFKMGNFDGSDDGKYNPTFTIVAAADMAITVPNIEILGTNIGGWKLAQAGVGVYLTPTNGNSADDYVAAAFKVNLGILGKPSVGVKINGNGKVDLWGVDVKDIEKLKNKAKAAPPAAAAALGEADDSANPAHLLCLNWEGSNSDPVITFKLHNGEIKTEAEMLAEGKVILQEDLSTDTQRVYGVVGCLGMEIAQWEYTVSSASAAASGNGIAAAPVVVTPALMEILQSNEIESAELKGGNGFPYQFNVEVPNTSNDAKVSIFLDDDGIDDYNGSILIGEMTLGELSTFKWTPPADLAAGTYRVYVAVEDNTDAKADEETGNTSGGKVPVRAYFEDTITVQQPITLSTPANLRFTQSAQTTLILDWNDVPDATEYILQRFNGSSYETIYTGADSQYVDRGLTENTSYSYRVQAVGSAFSIEISARTASKIVGGKEVTDSPVVLSTVTSDGKTTVTWTNLGSDYRYLVYKDAQLVVNLGSATSYVDPNPAATGTYSVYAYNDTLKKWSWATPIVVTATAPKIEITGHEILPDGSIKLTWNGVGTNYMVYQSGFPASGMSYLKTTDWTDTKPLAENQYQIYASYVDPADGRTKWTWSNIYFVTKPAAASAASPLDAFWAEYNNSVVDDDVLNGIV